MYYGSITFSVKILNERIIKLKYSDKKMTDTNTHIHTQKSKKLHTLENKFSCKKRFMLRNNNYLEESHKLAS